MGIALIPLLPTEIARIVIKIDQDKADDFQYVKQVLFNRFKLSARALQTKFENHGEKSDDQWVDLVCELRGYLDNWLETLWITNFESLKEQILIEQLKKRAPIEIKQHFVDVWNELTQARELAEKCDKYESMRRDRRRWDSKAFARNSFEMKNSKFVPDLPKNSKDSKSNFDKNEKKEVMEPKVTVTEIEDMNFDRRSKRICHLCNERCHIRPNCP